MLCLGLLHWLGYFVLFVLTTSLSTQEYNWVPMRHQGNLMKGWAVIYKGLSFLFSVIKALRISFGHMGYLGYKQTHKR